MLHAHAYFLMPLPVSVLMPVPHDCAYFLILMPVSVRMLVPHAHAYFLMHLSVSRMGCLNASGIP